MSFYANSQFRCFFTREELIKSPRSLLNARIVRCDLFEKTTDGKVIRFVIRSLMLSDGRVIPMVDAKGGAKWDHRGGVKRDQLASTGLSP